MERLLFVTLLLCWPKSYAFYPRYPNQGHLLQALPRIYWFFHYNQHHPHLCQKTPITPDHALYQFNVPYFPGQTFWLTPFKDKELAGIHSQKPLYQPLMLWILCYEQNIHNTHPQEPDRGGSSVQIVCSSKIFPRVIQPPSQETQCK